MQLVFKIYQLFVQDDKSIIQKRLGACKKWNLSINQFY